ncbi:MAG: tRNA lysidine(34) synthetase TilS [Anaerolineae bacterium]|nr:tRNA lysidine(34) synthetase TilS [Thermoflexales bacterium]MDW8406878.1 tRNA lysidine(34) synthetase TilS [Anaerolineae bacterium]
MEQGVAKDQSNHPGAGQDGTRQQPQQRVWLAVRRAIYDARAYFRNQDTPLPSPTPIVLAVSGGPDSLCLADAILSQREPLGLAPCIAHLDHGLRGEAGQADAEFTRAFAEAHGAPCVVARADVAGRAAAERVSIEVAARRARYEFLARVADSIHAPLIAVAHQADDQAETVLLRLIRGAGIAGLRGMRLLSPHPSAPHLWIVRPLLRITRGNVLAYCTARDLHPRLDQTNETLDHARNRVRHELLPILEQYNPAIRAVLARLAELAAGDLEIIEHAVEQTFNAIAHHELPAQDQQRSITLDRTRWQALPSGLQRAVLRRAVRACCGHLTDLKSSAIEEARDVLNSSVSSGMLFLRADTRLDIASSTFTITVESSLHQT